MIPRRLRRAFRNLHATRPRHGLTAGTRLLVLHVLSSAARVRFGQSQTAGLDDSPPGKGTKENVLHFRYPAKSKTTSVTHIYSRFIHHLAISLHIILMHCFYTFAAFSSVSSCIPPMLHRACAKSRRMAPYFSKIASLRICIHANLHQKPPNLTRIPHVASVCTAFSVASRRFSGFLIRFHAFSFKWVKLRPITRIAAGHAALQRLPFYYILRAWASRTTRNG